MQVPSTNLCYGIALDDDQTYELMQRLAPGMTLTEQKLAYLGWSVQEDAGYDDMSLEDKEEWDEVNTDDPDFMVNDFGEAELDDLLQVIETKYPSLGFNTFDFMVTIYTKEANLVIDYAGNFDIQDLTNISDNAKNQLNQFIQDYKISETPGYLALSC